MPYLSESPERLSQDLDSVNPCIFPRSSPAPEQGSTHSFRVFSSSLPQPRQVLQICSRLRISLAEYIQVIWQLTLHSYTQTETVCFGSATLTGHKYDLSLFSATHSTSETFEDALLESRHRQLSLASRTKWDFARYQELFNTGLVIKQNTTSTQQDSHDFMWEQCDIVLTVDVMHDSIALTIHYSTSTIPRELAHGVTQSLQHISDMIISSPISVHAHMDNVSAHDLAQLKMWNYKHIFSEAECLHRAFEHTVRSRPQASAVCAWDGNLTYQELDSVSSKLARYLTDHSVGLCTMVPIIMEKSKWSVISTIGVLKAGGVCVPINPAFPARYIVNIVESMKPKICMVTETQARKLRTILGHTACIAQDLVLDHLTEQSPSCTSVSPEDPAFLVFTSGSTGRPKGAVLTHRSQCTMARNNAHAYGIGVVSRIFQFAAQGWSISICDMLTTLLQGACLCMPSDEEKLNDLGAAIRGYNATHVVLPPSVANTLSPETVPALKTLILGGEAVSSELVVLWSKALNVLMNYGSAETCLSITSRLTRARKPGVMGHATPANRCWIVNVSDHHKLVPIGGVGELVVESAVVTTGYYDDEAASLQAIIRHPAWIDQFDLPPQRHCRFYKTGDLVRHASNGKLVLIGRKTDQIKLRGQRLEPGEVEHNIRSCLPGIKEVVACVAKPVGSQKDILVAVLCPLSSSSSPKQTHETDLIAAVESLRDKLKHLVPSYMIPNGFFLVHNMPRTVSGKLNRKEVYQLANDSSITNIIGGDGQQAPTDKRPLSTAEETMRQHWCKLLKLNEQDIGANSNFFGLGGDSIDAIQLVERLRGDCLSLSVASLFTSPVLSDMTTEAKHFENTTNLQKDITVAPFSLVRESALQELMIDATEQCRLSSKKDIETIYPCTPLQEGLMALSQQQTGAYVARHVFDLPREWDLSRFRSAWDRLVWETPILRTRIIHSRSEGYFQVVLRQNTVDDMEEFSNVDTAFKRHPSMGFGEPLFCCAVVRTAHVDKWIWTVHHSVYDGWTTALVLDRLTELYSPAKSDSVVYPQFDSFVKHLTLKSRSDSENYWRSQLQGYGGQEFPRLPSTYYMPRPNDSVRRTMQIPALTSNLTLSTSIRGAWSLILARYSRTSDVAFGITVSGRSAPVPGIKDIIGPAIATIPCRVHFESDQTVDDFLAQLQIQSTSMMNHEQFGLQNIQGLGEDEKTACGFQSLLIIQPESKDISGIARPREQVIDSNSYLTYAMTLECTLGTDGIAVDLDFDNKIISRSQVERIVHQFEQVLCQMQDKTVRKGSLKKVDMLSAQDTKTLRTWNSKTPSTIEDCMHSVIESRALGYPDSTAIDSWDGQLTYFELLDLATHLATYLQSLGVGPEVFVPLCFSKSMWTIVAMFAVMKAGGAFVLVDASHPKQRLQTIFQTVNARVALCSPDHVKLCSELADIVVPVTKDMEFAVQADPGISSVTPRNAMYVVFTSGSSGIPKGSVTEHRSCLSGFQDQVNKGFFNRSSRVLSFSSYSFDTCLTDMLGTLLAGGCVCIPREDERLNDLKGVLNRFKVNQVELTPSVAGLIKPNDVPSLKVLRLGGEAVTQPLVDRWASHVSLENSYGPSEACVTSVATTAVKSSANPSNIGFAVGCTTWIVDPEDYRKLAPIGVIGELVLQGPIVSRGYLRNEEATRSAYIQDFSYIEELPLSDRRCYRTGDLARYDDDGSIICLGRKDNQIKLRGQRIDLGEIESRLSMQEGAQTSMVCLATAGSFKGNLVAVIAPCEDRDESEAHSEELQVYDAESLKSCKPHAERLRSGLEESLPAYMVPNFYVFAHKLPSMKSGKIDRKTISTRVNTLEIIQAHNLSLQASEDEESKASSLSEDDKIALEVHSIILSLLNAQEKEQARDRNIQAFGLDSITKVGLMNSVNQKYGIKLGISTFMRPITVCQLARHIESKIGQGSNGTTKSNGIHGTNGTNAGHDHELEEVDFIKRISTYEKQLLKVSAVPREQKSGRTSLRNVFVTGATGYLGTQILRDLITRENVGRIIALVRSTSLKDGMRRVVQTAKLAKWWREEYASKLEVWLGDLRQDGLGLTDRQWHRLEGKASPEICINAIVHNGAVVDWFGDYETLKKANLDSSMKLIFTAKASKYIHRIIYVSGGPQWSPETDDDTDEAIQACLSGSNGYGQTKLVVEHALLRAAEKDKVLKTLACVVKPGFVIGTNKEGISNTDDYVWRIVAGSIAVGGWPREPGPSWICVSGADDYAETVVKCLENGQGDVRHKLLNGLQPDRFWEATSRAIGKPMESLSHGEWVKRLKESVKQTGSQHPCWPIMHMAESDANVLGVMTSLDHVSQDQEAKMETTVQKNIDYLSSIGFLDSESREKLNDEAAPEVFKRRQG